MITAYSNEAVTSISLSNDIVKGTVNLTTDRKTSFSIEGNNHSLDLGNQVFRVQQAATATFSISNIKTTAINTTGIVSSGLDTNTAKSGWTINITNVNSPLHNKMSLASVPGAQLNLAGDIKWYTASEMAVIDGVKIADNAKVMSIKQKQHEDRSFFWFAQAYMDQTSAGSHNFVIGKNAVANFKMTGSGTAFPIVFAYYNELRLESGATYNATMPGNTFGSDYYKSSFIAEGNNKVNVTSLNAVAFNSTSKPQEESQFYIGPESEFYIIGATNQKSFTGNATDTARTKITIDSPKNYDMRNSSTANNSNSSIADVGFKEFTSKNSDVNSWSLDSNVAGSASYSTSTIDYVTQLAGGSVTSSDSSLHSKFKIEGLRRISDLNQDSEFNFKDITNAEYSMSGKVILGYVPDENGMDDEGNINYIPVYPGKDQTSIDLKDSFGGLHTNLKTDANGDITYKGEKLNKQNEIVQATATYGNHIQKEVSEYKVVDITPPDPTKLKTQNMSANTRKLEGTGEIGATVYLRLNGNLIESVTTQVDGEGNWSMDIPENTFIKDMEGQLFLEDKAGKAESLGTKAGVSDIYRDITKEYQKAKIQEILADNQPHIFTFYAEDSEAVSQKKSQLQL
nr:pectate lyase-like adhesive domain-containing protein [Brochothrix thermosphacta]